ncbi:MAG TPA: glycosyltransferase family 39 protein [Candidatus Methylomirabilis sp.]|nr:glycosyltransferase family 39 protein [Candidatus Methylomirabilis sp.]
MRAEGWARRGFWVFAAIHLLLWTIIPLWIQPNPPLDTVEVVAWGHEWQLGYQKHPPLVAWLAETARSIGGSAGRLWPIYLLGQLCVVIAFWAVWRLGVEIAGARLALAAVLVLEATGRYTWMTFEFNHSLVDLPCFALTTLFLHRALARRRLRWWLAAGVAFGIGIMAKYTILLLGVAVIVFVLSNREARRRAAGPGPYLALAVAGLIVLPHAVWLVANGFPTISYVAERARSHAGVAGHIVNPLDFLGRQLLMLEFLFIALLLALAWPLRIRVLDGDPRFTRQFLLAAALGPGLVLALVSVVTGVQLHAAWGMPLWSTLGVLVLFCFETRPDPPLLRRAVLACAVFAVINVVLALTEGVAGPYVRAKGFRTHFPGRLLAERAAEAWGQRFAAPLPLVAGERWLAGNVAFFAPSRPSVLTDGGLGAAILDESACPWTSVADLKNRGGILVWSVARQGAPLPAELKTQFPDAEILPAVILPWQTGAPLEPVRIGLAIVAPTRATAGR